MNYQNLVSVLSAEAEADYTDLGFDNSCYHAQHHPIIVYCHPMCRCDCCLLFMYQERNR